MNQLTLKVFAYPEEFSQMQAIRRTVFQEEQGVDPSLDFDGLDETAEHILAYLDHQPVGTARVRYLNQQTAKIERLAVLPIARGLGLGKKLMEKAIDLASQKDVEEVVIHAQEYVKGLHQKLGFEQVGDIFYEAGIPHVEMIKKLK
jgi:predicted GNAT family N-acyltransferase